MARLKTTKKRKSPRRRSRRPNDVIVPLSIETHFFFDAHTATIQSRYSEKYATDPVGPGLSDGWNKEHPLPDYTKYRTSDDCKASSSAPDLYANAQSARKMTQDDPQYFLSKLVKGSGVRYYLENVSSVEKDTSTTFNHHQQTSTENC